MKRTLFTLTAALMFVPAALAHSGLHSVTNFALVAVATAACCVVALHSLANGRWRRW